MPKETKDLKEKETKKTVAKKTTSKAKATTSSAKSPAKKATTKASSTTATKKKTVAKSSTKKASTTKKTTPKKSTTTGKATKATEPKKFINEYYDLPYRYNQTVVKILAQTPEKLFVYWDISDEDRDNFKKTYGENFFERTKPVLIIHNDTLGYSFEIDINDFANSWYLDINDARCEYTIELGRRPNPYYYNPSESNEENPPMEIPQYIYISSSNNLEVPNNKVLYNPPVYKTVYFRNVKTNEVIAKDISEFPFVSNIENNGEFYNVYDLYKKFYKDEELNFINNPSSRGTSSSMNFSSQFK